MKPGRARNAHPTAAAAAVVVTEVAVVVDLAAEDVITGETTATAAK